MLDAANVTIKGIGDTTTDRIGNEIARGLAAGDPIATVTAGITDIIGNPDRAFTIAQTETSRAMVSSQASEYQALGFAQFEWLAYDGACDECLDQEDANPHEFGDDQPPGHPNCRCSIVGTGNVTTPEGALDWNGEPVANEPSGPVAEDAVTNTTTDVLETVGRVIARGATAPANTQFTFADIDEAVSHFRSLDIKIDGDAMKEAKITPKHLEQVAGALQDAEIKTPGMIDQLTHIQPAPDRSRYLAGIATMSESQNARYVARHGEDFGTRLYITKKLARTYNSPTQFNRLMTANERFFTARNLRDLYVHEFGHVGQYLAEDKYGIPMGPRFNSGGIFSKAMQEAGFLDEHGIKIGLDGLRDGGAFISENISEYAASDAQEFHSEVQVLFNSPERFAQLSQETQEMLIKYQKAVNDAAGFDLVKAEQAEPTTKAEEPKPTIIADDFGLPSEFYDDVDELD